MEKKECAAENKREYENFLYNVAWLRRHHGLSKTEMAKLLKISVKTLNVIESGKMPPRMRSSVYFRIQESFHIPPYVLLTYRLTE